MKVSLKDASPCRKVLLIDVESPEVRSEYQKVLGEYSVGARLPGFRPGRAPISMVERKHSKDILGDIQERMIPKCYREALKQQKIVPVAIVSVEDVKLALDTGMQFKVTLDVAPEFELPSYQGIPLKRDAKPVTEADVDAAIESVRGNHATFDDTSDRELAMGDLACVDYDGVVDGQAIAEITGAHDGLSEGKGMWAMLGGETELLPGADGKLVGQRPGAEVELDVPFPDDFTVKGLAGKTGRYQIRVKSVRGRKLPELNDEFLKKLGCDTTDILRARIRENLEAMRHAEERRRLKDGVVNFLLSKTSFDLPQSVLEDETNMAIQNMVQRSMKQGASREYIREKEHEIVEAASRSSVANTRLLYVLSRIAEAEKVAVSPEEVDAQVESIAQRQNLPPAKARAILEKRNAMERLHNDIRCEKTLDLLLEKATITD